VILYFSVCKLNNVQWLLTSKPLIVGTDPIIGRSWADRRWFVWPTILSGLVLLLYAPVVKHLVLQWWSDPDYSHGFFVPLFSGYIFWRQRERWMKIEIKPSNFGLLVMLGAVGLLLVGSLGAELFTTRFSLLVLLVGMILFLAGWKFLRAVSFPLCFLIFMIPLPTIVYNQITFPLQLLASRFATFWLELVHVPVLRDGNILVFSNYSLEVVEACSGIRSLMTLISLAVIYGYLLEPRLWVRILLVVLMVPIAILSNAIRIMGAGMMAHRFGPAAAEGFLHEFSGWVIFLVALLLLFAFHWILRHLRKVPREAAHA
jgi:exosortase